MDELRERDCVIDGEAVMNKAIQKKLDTLEQELETVRR